jgi:hypothetical protein
VIGIPNGRHWRDGPYGIPKPTIVNPKFLNLFEFVMADEFNGTQKRRTACTKNPCEKCTCSRRMATAGWRDLSNFGLGEFLPCYVRHEAGTYRIICDWKMRPIVRFDKQLTPFIVRPDDRNFHLGGQAIFPIGSNPEQDRVFYAGFLYAAGLGALPEIAWRFSISRFGRRLLEDWIMDWPTYGRE